jgi:hypothetical protein
MALTAPALRDKQDRGIFASMFDLFHLFVASHIVTGGFGLAVFWIPLMARKGGCIHRRAGRLFTWSMLATGTAAIGISICTLIDPIATHPQLQGHEIFGRPELVRAIFGWMMLGLAILTINLAWYGWLCVLNRNDHQRNREWRNIALQLATFIAASNCAWQGYLVNQPLMLGMSSIGWATALTNLYFLYKPKIAPNDWLKEHIKALVGTGISVYTAFFAFGAVRTFPSLALHPLLWAIPLTVGLCLIIYHQRKVSRPRNAAIGRRQA